MDPVPGHAASVASGSKKTNQKPSSSVEGIKAGDVLEGTVSQFGKNGTALVEVSSDSTIKKVFVNCDSAIKLNEKVTITVTRVKTTKLESCNF